MGRIHARQFHCWQQLIEWLCYREESLKMLLPPAQLLPRDAFIFSFFYNSQ